MNQPFTSEVLQQNVIEQPFANAKQLVKGYQAMKPIYDPNTFEQFKQKWVNDMQMIDDRAEELKAQYPNLADDIDDNANQTKAQMFPPVLDQLQRDKLNQAWQIHKNNLGVKQAEYGLKAAKYQDQQREDAISKGQFDAQVQSVIDNPYAPVSNFYIKKYDNTTGKFILEPHTVVTIYGKDFEKYGITKTKAQITGDALKINPDQKYIIEYGKDEKDKFGPIKAYAVDNTGVASFASKFQDGNTYLEKQNQQQQSAFMYEDGEVESSGEGVPVGKKTTTTTTQSGNTTTQTKTKTYTPAQEQGIKNVMVKNGITRQQAIDALIAAKKLK
jgi:hypothetical protein